MGQTGRISMLPYRTDGKRDAMRMASLRSAASMRKKPPSCSLVSANGPSVTDRWPLRMRMVVAAATGSSASEAITWPLFRSSASYSTWPMLTASSSRSEEHTSELQSRGHLVCRLLLEKKKQCYWIEEQMVGQ